MDCVRLRPERKVRPRMLSSARSIGEEMEAMKTNAATKASCTGTAAPTTCCLALFLRPLFLGVGRRRHCRSRRRRRRRIGCPCRSTQIDNTMPPPLRVREQTNVSTLLSASIVSWPSMCGYIPTLARLSFLGVLDQCCPSD